MEDPRIFHSKSLHSLRNLVGPLPLKKRRVVVSLCSPISIRSDEKTAALALLSARTIMKKEHSTSISSFLNSTMKSSTGRGRHPPLLTPLTNGCHGRTCRNNSYCRRVPRYNNSMYCKLHYQHYCVGNGSQLPDKKFTGGLGETICVATTTRGRPCAYVAVSGGFCHLHKGGRKRRRGEIMENIVIQKETNLKEELGLKVTGEKVKSDLDLQATKGISGVNIFQRLELNNAKESRQLPSTTLSLNTIDPAKWPNTYVRILTGPLSHRNGIVLSHDDGWVILKTPFGLHRRRAFDLEILRKDNEDDSFTPEKYCDQEIARNEINQEGSLALKSQPVSFLPHETSRFPFYPNIFYSLKHVDQTTDLQYSM